jgi:hypothetical protein
VQYDTEPQESQDRELVVNMVRNHGNAPSQWCNRGALYPVLGAAELPARWRYTTYAFAGADIHGFAPGDRMRANNRVEDIGQVPDCRGEGTAEGVLLGSSPMDRP